MSVWRCPKNPVIGPKDVRPLMDGFEVVGAFNAGVTRLSDEVILLLRVAERPVSNDDNIVLTAIYDPAKNGIIFKKFNKSDPHFRFLDSRMMVTREGKFLTSISYFRIARSKDGINFEIDDKAAIFPANEYETFGIEDPRITVIDGVYYIVYVGVCPVGVTSCLASTQDFKSFQRHGVIFCPENKDVALFPQRVNGKYYALHRPVTPLFEKHHMWIADSPDLVSWGNHRYLMGGLEGCFDVVRVGGGAAPFKIDQGWLEIYHGVDKNGRYCLGAVLLDSKEPWKIIARTKEPILAPEIDYELEGFFGNVVFTCGLLFEQDKLKIYYGVADTSIAYAEIDLADILAKLNE
jgi:beta-1,2-mannobiose phosphorylase / 1,2-beta-oligomannan phosphorylase